MYTPHEAILDLLAASGPQGYSAMVHEVIAQCIDIETHAAARGHVIASIADLVAAGLIEAEDDDLTAYDLTAFGWDMMTRGGCWIIEFDVTLSTQINPSTLVKFNTLVEAQTAWDTLASHPDLFLVFGHRPC